MSSFVFNLEIFQKTIIISIYIKTVRGKHRNRADLKSFLTIHCNGT